MSDTFPKRINQDQYKKLPESVRGRYYPFTDPRTKQTTYSYSGPSEKGLKIVSPEFQILTMGRQAAGLKLGKAFNEWKKLRNVRFNLDKSTEAANGKEAFRNFATRLVSVLNPLFYNGGKFNYKYKFK